MKLERLVQLMSVALEECEEAETGRVVLADGVTLADVQVLQVELDILRRTGHGPDAFERMISAALRQATRAVEAGEWVTLGTVNEHIQPLVDAFMVQMRKHASHGGLCRKPVMGDWQCRRAIGHDGECDRYGDSVPR